jgi:hypothetical protein
MTQPADVERYLASLSAERRSAIEVVRECVLEHLPQGLTEEVGFGMLTYVVPLSVQPHTYNGKPLLHTALANQKHHMALYLMGIYGNPDVKARFEADYRATGKRYDTGASCVRFRMLEDLPLGVVGAAVSSVSVADLVAMHEGVRSLRKARGR